MSLIKTAKENLTPGKIDSLIIASRPGMGKTEALMQLPNCIYFDQEGSSGHYTGNCDIVNIKDIMKDHKCGPITANKKAIDEIKKSGKEYDFCVIDTASKVDDFAEALALRNYKNSPQGSSFTGDSIFELDYGAGYMWHRNAFQEIIDMFDGVAKTMVLVCHVKDSSIKKDGNNITASDIRLTGALKEIFSSKQDAAGILTMDKDEPNRRYLDFSKTEDSIFIKCRPQHIAGKKVLLSEKQKDGTLKTNWKAIFPSLSKKVVKSEQS